MHQLYVKLISIVFIPFGLVSFVQANENFRQKIYTFDSGLSHNFVQGITQDQTGFLWIATWDGLNRFDGNEFKSYYHTPGDTNSFPFFCVDKVLVDQMNKVWIFSQGRPAHIYNRADDCFNKFSFGLGYETHLSDIAVGMNNTIWFICGNTLNRYQQDNKQLSTYEIILRDKPLILFSNDLRIALDNKGEIWIYYLKNQEFALFKGILKDYKLQVYSLGTIPINKFKSSELHNNLGNFEFYSAESGNIWLFSKYGLYNISIAENCFKLNSAPINPNEFTGKPYFVYNDDSTGIHIIDTEKKSTINLKPDTGDFTEFVFIDRSNTIWSGNINSSRENMGLNKYIKIPDYFKHFLNKSNEKGKANLIFPILKDKNSDLWVGTRYLDYLFRIKSDGKEEKININNGNDHPDYLKAKSMVEDSSGIWIACTNDHLFYYNFRTERIQKILPNSRIPKEIDFPLAFHNLLKKGNSLIINGGKGISRYNPETNNLILGYRHKPEGSGFTLVEDGKNGFWVGSFNNTVIHLDSLLNEIATYKIGLENNIAEHICIGDNEDIWIALMGGGLGHLYPETGKTEILTTANGLSNNTLYSIVKDKKGDLWISTNQGISRFKPETKHFTNFGNAEGLQINEFNSDSYFQSPDGEIFFGGVGGLVSFYPESIDQFINEKVAQPLIITDLKVSGITRHFNKPVYVADTITLRKGETNFQITFSCLNYKFPEKIKYRYRLAPHLENWTETSFRNRNVSYANLTPGKYIFEVEATDNKQEWNSDKKLLIVIPYKTHETVWFRILLLLGILFLITLITFFYAQQFRLKERQLKNELKLETLRGQMNPHFIFNSLNSINYFISKSDRVAANAYIADFSRLIRGFLTNLSQDFIPFANELQSISDYLKLEHLRFGDKFDYSIDVETINLDGQMQIFPGMVQPFIENAIWHGIRNLENRKGSVKITFGPFETNSVTCIIEDDGVGRKLAELYKNELPWKKSQGLGIVQERIRIINNMWNSDFKVKIEDLFPNQKETGTRVIINIPIKKN